MAEDLETVVEREVQRRLGRKMQQHTAEVAELRSIIADCQDRLTEQNKLIAELGAASVTFARVVKLHNSVDPWQFNVNDEVLVVDQSSPHFRKGGCILASPVGIVDEDGYCSVKLNDGLEERFAVGLEGRAPAQIRLSTKADGTYAIVREDNKLWQVRGIPDLTIGVGDMVKITPDNKAIVGLGDDLGVGPICWVKEVLDDCVEVIHKGEEFLLLNPRNVELLPGDRIVADPSLFYILKKLPRPDAERYKIKNDLTVTWDDVGGLEGAKRELRDAIELPFQHPDLFRYYGVDPIRGILLFGPPGCGKTLLVRVTAWAVANLHGKLAVDSGYLYVKAPEILDKWVGNTEKEIREIFEIGRRHYREHGYKAILAIDEADAILPQRGTRRSSDVSDTIVPMFLGEMDGVDQKQSEENPIVVLMTNRADVLDPAVTRPGRIDRHIKVERPDEMASIDILGIHSNKVPFADDKNRMSILALATSDLFSRSRVLYRINNEHDFTLGDCVNGAMLANIVGIAKMNALHRDLNDKAQTGITTDDLRTAVQKTFNQQRGANHTYDLSDWCEKTGIQFNQATIERCFGAA